MTDQQAIGTLKALDVIEQADGSLLCIIEITDEFKIWFTKNQDMKRFSPKRFERWFLAMLRDQFSLP